MVNDQTATARLEELVEQLESASKSCIKQMEPLQRGQITDEDAVYWPEQDRWMTDEEIVAFHLGWARATQAALKSAREALEGKPEELFPELMDVEAAKREAQG